VLIWALGFFVLMYLYFFVYYTATLTIISNQADYRGELVSVQNAQNIAFECPEKECTISDIPPFDYRLTIFKDDFKTYNTSVSMKPRSSQMLEFEFVRDPRLTLTSVLREGVFVRQDEWLDEGIYLSFSTSDTKIFFREIPGRSALDIWYEWNGELLRLWEVPRIQGSQIFVQSLYASDDIHIQVWNQAFIYEQRAGKLIELPFDIPVRYIKHTNTPGHFHIITDLWSFTYKKQTNTTEYQYLFFDSVVVSPENIIGIILPGDSERRQNFNLEDEDTLSLIVHYNSRTRERKTLLTSSQDFREIHREGEQIILINSQWETYSLENFN